MVFDTPKSNGANSAQRVRDAKRLQENQEAVERITQAIADKTINKARDEFVNMHLSDQAVVLDFCKRETCLVLLGSIANDFAPELLFYISHKTRVIAIEVLGYARVCETLDTLSNEEVLKFLKGFSQIEQLQIVKNLSIQKRREIRLILSYPEKSAGRVMDLNFVVVTDDFTVAEVATYIRSNSIGLPTKMRDIFIVNDANKVIGSISIEQLVKNELSRKIIDISDVVVTVQASSSQEDIIQLFQKYNLNTLPVVEEDDRLIGSISVETMRHISSSLGEEEILKMSGVHSDLDEGIFDTTRVRFLWLFVNLSTTSLASWVISFFEQTIHDNTALAVLMPITVSMGSNAGMQTAAVIIRSIATKQINRNNANLYLNKELIISLINAVLLGIVCIAGVFMIYKDVNLALVFGSAVAFTLVISVISGVVAPIVMKLLKTDPAVTATVFLTTVIEVVAFVSFLGLAKLFLH